MLNTFKRVLGITKADLEVAALKSEFRQNVYETVRVLEALNRLEVEVFGDALNGGNGRLKKLKINSSKNI